MDNLKRFINFLGRVKYFWSYHCDEWETRNLKRWECCGNFEALEGETERHCGSCVHFRTNPVCDYINADYYCEVDRKAI